MAGINKMIWAYGPDDSVSYHEGRRGTTGIAFYKGEQRVPRMPISALHRRVRRASIHAPGAQTDRPRPRASQPYAAHAPRISEHKIKTCACRPDDFASKHKGRRGATGIAFYHGEQRMPQLYRP